MTAENSSARIIDRPFSQVKLRRGHIALFHRSDPSCPSIGHPGKVKINSGDNNLPPRPPEDENPGKRWRPERPHHETPQAFLWLVGGYAVKRYFDLLGSCFPKENKLGREACRGLGKMILTGALGLAVWNQHLEEHR